MSGHHRAITPEGERFPSPRSALEYLDGQPPEPGQARQLDERLWWARIPLPIELNHINVWLLDDGDGWTLIDTGMAEDVCREAWGSLEAAWLGGRPLRRVFITHDHPDHMGLAQWLCERHGARLSMSAFAHAAATQYLATPGLEIRRRMMEFVRLHGMAMPERAMRPGDGQDEHRWLAGVPALERGCADGDELSAGGRVWRLIETNGHCRGHLCAYDEQGGHLVCGDQVLPTISPNVSVIASRPDEDPLGAYLESLDRLEQLPEQTLVLPSHGRPYRGLRQRIGVIRGHHLQQLDALRAACSEPKSAFELLPVMYGRTLRGFHRFLAMGETVAHLHWLWHRRELERQVAADGSISFSRS